MISGTLQDPANGYARFQGYKKALETAGIEYQEDLVRIGNYRYESGVEAMKYFLGLKKKPTAIFSLPMRWQLALFIAFRMKATKCRMISLLSA